MAKSRPLGKLTKAGRVNRRRAADDEPKGWWKSSRRAVIVGGALTTGVALAGGGLWLATRDDSFDLDQDSLDLQRSSGWNVGSEEKRLTLTGAQGADSQQNANWAKYLDQSAMLTAYQPKAEAWLPFFVPTLIQSLQFETLRGQLAPIYTPDMAEAYGRGQAIARDFLANAANPGETALIVDLPGRASIAFGAGLADTGRLITTFDNYPHPLGVTPAHETLAAMLYYAGEVEAKQTAAPATAPPVFLLDAKRLEPYGDADTQFDNRYLAKLPSAQKFRELGIKSIIYVTPDRTRAAELDDLNEDFVEYKNNGLGVAVLPLSDFTRSAEGSPQQAGVNSGGGGGSWEGTNDGRYYYGGSPGAHFWFFHSYPFYRPAPSFAGRFPGYAAGARAVAPPVTPPAYVPVTRPTMFAGARLGNPQSAGVGRSKPSGFGRTTVRVSRSGGVLGTRAGRSGYYSPSRSGSFGRGGWFSG